MTRLKKAQKEALLRWIVEGLQSNEINERAKAFDEPFQVSRQQVDFYRKSRDVRIREIRERSEQKVLTTSLAKVANRIRKLEELALRLEDDLFEKNKIWVRVKKALGSGPTQEIIWEKIFNKSEVEQYRGILDDIAREMGERKQSVEIEGGAVLNVVRIPAKASADEWRQQVQQIQKTQ